MGANERNYRTAIPSYGRHKNKNLLITKFNGRVADYCLGSVVSSADSPEVDDSGVSRCASVDSIRAAKRSSHSTKKLKSLSKGLSTPPSLSGLYFLRDRKSVSQYTPLGPLPSSSSIGVESDSGDAKGVFTGACLALTPHVHPLLKELRSSSVRIFCRSR